MWCVTDFHISLPALFDARDERPGVHWGIICLDGVQIIVLEMFGFLNIMIWEVSRSWGKKVDSEDLRQCHAPRRVLLLHTRVLPLPPLRLHLKTQYFIDLLHFSQSQYEKSLWEYYTSHCERWANERLLHSNGKAIHFPNIWSNTDDHQYFYPIKNWPLLSVLLQFAPCHPIFLNEDLAGMVYS